MLVSWLVSLLLLKKYHHDSVSGFWDRLQTSDKDDMSSHRGFCRESKGFLGTPDMST